MTSRVALVTGGTGGIGTAICKQLHDQGHRVASNYRDAARARLWQQQMRQAGYDIGTVQVLLTKPLCRREPLTPALG